MTSLHWEKIARCIDLVAIDEAHHMPAATWQAFLSDHPHRIKRQLLFTATPFRTDKQPLQGEPVISILIELLSLQNTSSILVSIFFQMYLISVSLIVTFNCWKRHKPSKMKKVVDKQLGMLKVLK